MNLVHRAVRVDSTHDFRVVLQKWIVLSVVDAKAGSDDVFGIVSAPTSEHSFDNGVLTDREIQDCIEFDIQLVEDAVESGCLFDGSRKTIEDEARDHIIARKSVPHHGDGDIAGNELTSIDIGLGGSAEFGALCDVTSKQVSGGDVYDVHCFGQQLGLGSFSCSRRSGEDDAHLWSLLFSVFTCRM